MAPSLLSSFSFSDNTIGFIIDGPYDKVMNASIQAEIQKKLEVYEKLNFYIEDTENAKISIIKTLKNLPFKTKLENRFSKVAVVTDRKWLRFVRNIENKFLNADLKVFTCAQRLEAIQWISH